MMTPAAARPEERANHFNFLRLLLAACVLFSHAAICTDGDDHREPLVAVFHNLSLGELAVTGFFLLSGFLIVRSWERRPVLAGFLLNRVLRIYPGYVVAAVISVVFVGAVGAADPGRYLARIDGLRLLKDLALLQAPATPATFTGAHLSIVNGSLWTISYEFRCYLGVALLGLCGVIRRRWAFLALTLMVAGVWLLPLAAHGLLTFSLAHFGRTGADRVYRLLLLANAYKVFLHLLLFFCAGGCFALFRDRVRLSGRWALAALAVLVPCMFSLVASQLALLTLGAYAFFTFAHARVPALAFFKGHTDISYGVYLYGWPVQQLLNLSLPGQSPYTLFALSVGVSAAAGWASWRFVERPFLRLKARRSPAAAAGGFEPEHVAGPNLDRSGGREVREGGFAGATQEVAARLAG